MDPELILPLYCMVHQQMSPVQTMCKHLWHCSTLNILLLNLENINILHYILNSEDIFLPLRCPAMHVVSWSVRLVWNQVSYFAPSSDEYKENQAPEDQNCNHDNCTGPIHCPEYCKNIKIKMCFIVNKISFHIYRPGPTRHTECVLDVICWSSI